MRLRRTLQINQEPENLQVLDILAYLIRDFVLVRKMNFHPRPVDVPTYKFLSQKALQNFPPKTGSRSYIQWGRVAICLKKAHFFVDF